MMPIPGAAAAVRSGPHCADSDSLTLTQSVQQRNGDASFTFSNRPELRDHLKKLPLKAVLELCASLDAEVSDLENQMQAMFYDNKGEYLSIADVTFDDIVDSRLMKSEISNEAKLLVKKLREAYAGATGAAVNQLRLKQLQRLLEAVERAKTVPATVLQLLEKEESFEAARIFLEWRGFAQRIVELFPDATPEFTAINCLDLADTTGVSVSAAFLEQYLRPDPFCGCPTTALQYALQLKELDDGVQTGESDYIRPLTVDALIHSWIRRVIDNDRRRLQEVAAAASSEGTERTTGSTGPDSEAAVIRLESVMSDAEAYSQQLAVVQAITKCAIDELIPRVLSNVTILQEIIGRQDWKLSDVNCSRDETVQERCSAFSSKYVADSLKFVIFDAYLDGHIETNETGDYSSLESDRSKTAASIPTANFVRTLLPADLSRIIVSLRTALRPVYALHAVTVAPLFLSFLVNAESQQRVDCCYHLSCAATASVRSYFRDHVALQLEQELSRAIAEASEVYKLGLSKPAAVDSQGTFDIDSIFALITALTQTIKNHLGECGKACYKLVVDLFGIVPSMSAATVIEQIKQCMIETLLFPRRYVTDCTCSDEATNCDDSSPNVLSLLIPVLTLRKLAANHGIGGLLKQLFPEFADKMQLEIDLESCNEASMEILFSVGRHLSDMLMSLLDRRIIETAKNEDHDEAQRSVKNVLVDLSHMLREAQLLLATFLNGCSPDDVARYLIPRPSPNEKNLHWKLANRQDLRGPLLSHILNLDAEAIGAAEVERLMARRSASEGPSYFCAEAVLLYVQRTLLLGLEEAFKQHLSKASPTILRAMQFLLIYTNSLCHDALESCPRSRSSRHPLGLRVASPPPATNFTTWIEQIALTTLVDQVQLDNGDSSNQSPSQSINKALPEVLRRIVTSEEEIAFCEALKTEILKLKTIKGTFVI